MLKNKNATSYLIPLIQPFDQSMIDFQWKLHNSHNDLSFLLRNLEEHLGHIPIAFLPNPRTRSPHIKTFPGYKLKLRENIMQIAKIFVN